MKHLTWVTSSPEMVMSRWILKVDVVKNFPIPQTLKELQRFLGLAGYYRHFITDYAMIAAPLTDMTVVGVKVNMTGEALEVFEQIKSSFELCPHPMPSRLLETIFITD